MKTKFDVNDKVFFIKKTWVRDTCDSCGHSLVTSKRIPTVIEGRITSITVSSVVIYTLLYNKSFNFGALEKDLYKTKEEAEENL